MIREPNLSAEVASQHEVGNHTFTHPHLTWSRPGTAREELLRGQEAIHDATGTLPRLFRVPHGWYGPQVISVAGELGMRCVGWSVMAWDWDRPPADVIQRRILHGVGPGGVTLLHDGQDTDAFPKADRSHTMAAVSDIISSLKASGYGFLTLPELMDLDARDEEGARPFLIPSKSAFSFCEPGIVLVGEWLSSPKRSLSLSTAGPGAGSVATASPIPTTESFGTFVSPPPRAMLDPPTSKSHSQATPSNSREKSLITKRGRETFSAHAVALLRVLGTDQDRTHRQQERLVG